MKEAQIVVLGRRTSRGVPPQIRRQAEPAEAGHHRAVARRRWPAALREFSPAALEVFEAPPSPARKVTVLVLCALLVTALAWSWFGRLAVYADAPGRIQAAGRSKVIEPRATGVVTAIVARDGDQVRKGQVLVRLDPTNAAATAALIAKKRADLYGQMAGWRAEIAAAPKNSVDRDPVIDWAAKVPQQVRRRETEVVHADLARLSSGLADLAAQRAEKVSESKKYAGAIAAQKALIATISQSVGMHQQLEKQGWDSKANLLSAMAQLKSAETALTGLEGSLAAAQAAIPVIDSKIVTTRQKFIAADTQQLVLADRQVADLTQQLRKARQRLSLTQLRAPIDGTIQGSAVTTIGQVVKTGQQLMQIVPRKLPLQIQAYVQNTDIGFVKPGAKAQIKIAAFPYATYGTIDGKVTTVARNALPILGKNTLQTASLDGAVSKTTAAQNTGNIMFPIVVEPARNSIAVDGKNMPLSPGMAVEVDIRTEDRRPLSYILDPLIDLFSTAAHER